MTVWLILAALGAWTALDGVAVGQFMVSRPLVAGLLAGAAAGDAAAGALVGALLEIYLLVSVPSGGGRYPEPGPAAVVAGASAAWAPGAAGIALAVIAGLSLGWVGSVLQGIQREWLARRAPDPSQGTLDPGIVSRAHLQGIAVDAVRGTIVTLAGLGLVQVALTRIAHAWPLPETATWALVVPGACASLGVLARAQGGMRRWVFVAAGVALALVAGRLAQGGGA